MEYTYIPIGIKREFVSFGVDCDWKGKVVGLLEETVGQTVFSLTHIKGITLGPGEEVVGGASGMGVDRIGVVGYRASEG